MKYSYIRNSNKNTFPNTSKTSSLPRITSTNERKNYKDEILQNNLYYLQENQKLLLTNHKSCFPSDNSQLQRLNACDLVYMLNTNSMFRKK